nr:ATP-binding protein [uncultured Sphingomonas sp.]
MSPQPPLPHLLLEGIDEPALLLEGQTIIVANQAAHTLLGQGLAGRDIRLAIRHPLALEHIFGTQRGAAHSGNIDLVGIGSSERPWTLKVRPITGSMQMILLSDRTAAISAERMRTDFVANASHELRTPLATIMGYSETLADEGPLDEAMRRKFGDTIHSESERMLRIIEDLMSLSRIEADRYRMPSDEIDLAAIAKSAVSNSRIHAGQKQCDISLLVDGDIPTVRGDRGQLLQVVENLVSNAIRYGCQADGGKIDLTINLDGGMVRLAVKDYGDGIAAEHLPRLTERFYRVDDARSRNSGGTGLGLAIVKHIIERHRGQLDLRSTLHQGTEVIIHLPLG